MRTSSGNCFKRRYAWAGLKTIYFYPDEWIESAKSLMEKSYSFYTIVPEAESSVAFWNSMIAFVKRILAQG